MKTILLTLLLTLLYMNSFAQYLIIHKDDGSKQNLNLSEIDSISFSGPPCPGTPTVTYESKIYNTVLIGEQCWLKENLDVGIRRDGGTNQTENSIIEKYCYNNEPDSCDIYGGLYQWDEAMQYTTSEGAQGICPSGWHIPTLEEFQTLITVVDNDGNELKEIGQGSGGGSGTNISGFSAFLAGYRENNDGLFYNLGNTTFFWSSKKVIGTDPSSIYLVGYGSGTGIYNLANGYGASVRCIKD